MTVRWLAVFFLLSCDRDVMPYGRFVLRTMLHDHIVAVRTLASRGWSLGWVRPQVPSNECNKPVGVGTRMWLMQYNISSCDRLLLGEPADRLTSDRPELIIATDVRMTNTHTHTHTHGVQCTEETWYSSCACRQVSAECAPGRQLFQCFVKIESGDTSHHIGEVSTGGVFPWIFLGYPHSQPKPARSTSPYYSSVDVVCLVQRSMPSPLEE